MTCPTWLETDTDAVLLAPAEAAPGENGAAWSTPEKDMAEAVTSVDEFIVTTTDAVPTGGFSRNQIAAPLVVNPPPADMRIASGTPP
jgi:hypothetical protein